MIPVRLDYAGLVASFGAMKKPQSVGAWTIATFGGCSKHGAAAATGAVQTESAVYGGQSALTSKRLTLVAAYSPCMFRQPRSLRPLHASVTSSRSAGSREQFEAFGENEGTSRALLIVAASNGSNRPSYAQARLSGFRGTVVTIGGGHSGSDHDNERR
jgi:hypothetical protein